jgi:hypothetical protein
MCQRCLSSMWTESWERWVQGVTTKGDVRRDEKRPRNSPSRIASQTQRFIRVLSWKGIGAINRCDRYSKDLCKSCNLNVHTSHFLFFFRNSTNVDTHACMSTHPYEYTHTHPTPMSTSERLSRLDLKIHKVGYQE